MRTIFHIDMDAFYASVEQRDHPEYRGQPVIVGADPQDGRGRGVVAACSYEARRFGIHSALPISTAYRLCPKGVYLRPDFSRYVSVSREIREIFTSVTPLVEPVSIDEAFLDVSQQTTDPQQALELAGRLKARIQREQRLTASIGIGPCKLVAKIASDLRKPDGLVQVPPGEEQSFLDPLPISRIWGVGPRTEERLREMGIETILQMRRTDRALLIHRFGKAGEHMWCLASGRDNRPVVTDRETKSVGHEHTYSQDVSESGTLVATLKHISDRLSERLLRHGLQGKTVTLKLRYSDFTTITRQSTFREPRRSAAEIYEAAARLFENWRDSKPRVRLIGVCVSSFDSPLRPRQLRLFG